MVPRKEFILNVFLFILVICVGIGYVHQLHRIDELREIILIEKGLENENYVNKDELAIKYCEKELQTRRTNIDKCIDFNEIWKQNISEEIHNQKVEQNHEQYHKDLQQILKIGQVKLDECFEKRNNLKSKDNICFPEESVSHEDKKIFRKGSPVNKINNFVLFIGYPRSGGSILAAILDAHPHIVISNEFDPVLKWNNTLSQAGTKFDRYDLFKDINKAAWFNIHGGVRSPNLRFKYYTLDVPGLYQGQYKDYIQIIGDKKGGALVKLDNEDDGSERFLQMLEKFQDFVGYPLKLFHIVRNPFDNIATKFLYQLSFKSRQQAILSNITFEQTEDLVSLAKEHIESFEKIQRHIDYFGERMITLNQEDLISNPILFIKRMCNHMEIYCSNYYLETASKSVFSSSTKSRHSVKWKEDVITMIDSAIQKYTFLNRYSFEN